MQSKVVGGVQVRSLDLVAAHNRQQNQTYSDRQNDYSKDLDSYLLPMAFPKGSPMHPSYEAGHATVAGACVTMLKAFFDHGWRLDLGMEEGKYIAYEPNEKGNGLQKVLLDQPLTIEGELNKIASNISIGLDWAGVHYFSDYIESLRMGEQIAIAIFASCHFPNCCSVNERLLIAITWFNISPRVAKASANRCQTIAASSNCLA